MKKFTVLALAALLVVAFAMPASALENIFGGYWQTRFATQKNFDGDGTGALDIRQIDTRTRLYYTAKLNDKLKFVNKFEMDTTWGNTVQASATVGSVAGTVAGVQGNNWGDPGADGAAIEIKNSYADFNVGPVNFLVGIQNFTLARSFISNDDASGMKAIWKVNDGLYLPFIWQHPYEGGVGRDANEKDIDQYVFAPIIYLSKDIKINPYYVFIHSRNAALVEAPLTGLLNNVNGHILGTDFDAKMGPASLWFTGFMQFGSADDATGALTGTVRQEIDLKGYLLAVGGIFDLGKADIHGQVFYATGEDSKFGEAAYKDKELDAVLALSSSQYAWAEIMGQGAFDNMAGGFANAPTSAPGIKISNILAANLGVTVKPMAKLAVTADLWYAKLAEEKVFSATVKEDKLGLEADLKVTYQLVEGLSLDIIGAYLWAGDAISADGKNDKNPYEFGTRLSLSF